MRYFFLVLLTASSVFASVQPSAENRFFDAPETTEEMVVDGVLNEPFWNNALTIPLNYEIAPGNNITPPVETTAYLIYNRDAIMIGFDAKDPDPKAIRANLADRDKPNRDDFCGFTIDTFNDETRAFEFLSTAAGIQLDLVRNEQLYNEEDPTWDTFWQNASQISEKGYQTEMRIPWSSLRYPSGTDKKTFGFLLFRSYPRDLKYIFSAVPENRNIDNLLSQTMKISGFENISSGKNIEIQPTFTTTRTDIKEEPQSEWNNGDTFGSTGLSMRWGITPSISFSGTINPDFSQVEADELQLQVNNKDALYYKEKRPFFLEGASILSMPFRAVYTRSIAEPLLGAKLSGKQGTNSFSFYAVRDQQTNILLPSNEGSSLVSLDDKNSSGVFRLTHDLNNGSSVGLLGTARVASDYSNYVGGIDGVYRLNDQDFIKWQFLTTETEYPDQFAIDNEQNKSETGEAMVIVAGHKTEDWTAWTSIKRSDRGLRADNGFINRVDTKGIDAGVWKNHRQASGWYTELGIGLEGQYTEDTSGQVCDKAIQLEGSYNGPLQSGIWTMLKANEERYQGINYDMKFFMLHAGFHPTSNLFIGGGFRRGGSIDYKNGRLGQRLGGGPRIDWKITDNLQLYIDVTHEQMDVDDADYYTVNMIENRLVYNVSKETFIRAIMQYTHSDFHPDNEESLFTQLLFSHKVNPQTVLFLGYSDNLFGDNQWSMFRTDRSFFMKAAYAWQP